MGALLMSNQIDVARIDSAVYARVTGLGNFNNAAPLQDYVDAAVQSGVRTIIVDLARCSGLDSTFMGTMMGFLSCPGLPAGDSFSEREASLHVMVVNATPGAMRALQSVGLGALLDVREEHVDIPECRMQRLDDDQLNQARRVRLIKEAHEHLMTIDERNRKTFGPLIDMLTKQAGGE